MRAARIHQYGDADVLSVEEVPIPEMGPEDVRIRVHATSVNPVDIKIRKGVQRAIVWISMPWTLGLDVSGTVTEVGERVKRLSVGDEVFASPHHKRMSCYAEQVVVHADEVALKPKNISHLEAASLPLVALTAWDCFESLRLKPGQRVLIQAGSGGVGTAAIQIAKALGAEVVTTCSPRNEGMVRELGADEVIDYHTQDFEKEAAGVEAILDSVGGEAMSKAVRTVKRGGRVALIAVGLPEFTQRYGPVLGLLLLTFSLVGLWLKARLTRNVRIAMVTRKPRHQPLEQIAKWVESGQIRPVIDRVYPLEEIAEAHRYLDKGHARGKVVIDVLRSTN